MFLFKTTFLLYYLSLQAAQSTARPQLLVFHVDAPKPNSETSQSLLSSSISGLSKEAVVTDHVPQTHTALAASSTITGITTQSSVWVNLPPISGFSWPGVILSAKISTATLNLPPISGFSWPGVSFETTVMAPAPKVTSTTSTRVETGHSSRNTESAKTSHGEVSFKSASQTQSSHHATHTSQRKPSITASSSLESSSSKHTTTVTFQGQLSSIIIPPSQESTISFSELITVPITPLSYQTGLPNQGITQLSSFTFAAAATTSATPIAEPQIFKGSGIVLGVTIAGGVLLVCLLAWFLYRRRARRTSDPFSDEMAYNPANRSDSESPDIRPIWYGTPTAPPPSVNPTPPYHTPPNLDDLNDLVDPTDPFTDSPEPNKSKWPKLPKKLPWALGRNKKPAVYPEVAYLYDPPSVVGQDKDVTREVKRETFYEPEDDSSNRPSYESLTTAPEGRTSYESFTAVSALSANPYTASNYSPLNTGGAVSALSANQYTASNYSPLPTGTVVSALSAYPYTASNYSPLPTGTTRDMQLDSAFQSPAPNRTQFRTRNNSVEMSPRVRYLHEGSDEAVLELLPEGIEDWTPGEDTLAARGPILEPPIPEVPEGPPTSRGPIQEGNTLARHGSVSRDFAESSATSPIGVASSTVLPAPSWLKARGFEGLGIDTGVGALPTSSEAPGWSGGRWTGPPSKEAAE